MMKNIITKIVFVALIACAGAVMHPAAAPNEDGEQADQTAGTLQQPANFSSLPHDIVELIADNLSITDHQSLACAAKPYKELVYTKIADKLLKKNNNDVQKTFEN